MGTLGVWPFSGSIFLQSPFSSLVPRSLRFSCPSSEGLSPVLTPSVAPPAAPAVVAGADDAGSISRTSAVSVFLYPRLPLDMTSPIAFSADQTLFYASCASHPQGAASCTYYFHQPRRQSVCDEWRPARLWDRREGALPLPLPARSSSLSPAEPTRQSLRRRGNRSSDGGRLSPPTGKERRLSPRDR